MVYIPSCHEPMHEWLLHNYSFGHFSLGGGGESIYTLIGYGHLEVGSQNLAKVENKEKFQQSIFIMASFSGLQPQAG